MVICMCNVELVSNFQSVFIYDTNPYNIVYYVISYNTRLFFIFMKETLNSVCPEHCLTYSCNKVIYCSSIIIPVHMMPTLLNMLCKTQNLYTCPPFDKYGWSLICSVSPPLILAAVYQQVQETWFNV